MNLMLPKERNLYLVKQVDQESINNITKDVIAINENDIIVRDVYAAYGLQYTPKPIKIFIDSYGGAVYQCLGLASVIENSFVEVYTIATGCAMSAGFLLLISGHKRFAYSNATILYHQLSAGTEGTLEQMKDYIIHLNFLDKKLIEFILRKTGFTEKFLNDLNIKKKDFYMTAKEALEFGVIDKII